MYVDRERGVAVHKTYVFVHQVHDKIMETQ